MSLLPGSSPRKPTYSIKWAESIVKNLYEKHTRGANFWSDLSRISQEQMAMILARNTGEWHHIRRMVAKMDFQYHLMDIQPWKSREMIAMLGNLLIETAEKAREDGKKTFADFLEDLTGRIPLVYS